ncbi:MAG TPA: dihydrofolate reductase family protein [Anaeromyxobacteraceae bacterium]|nr:dihydrofolate reductase family protein [Anaeromyxobacteraceae bacterium]
MDRPHCAVFIATSVDGYIALPDGSVRWLDAVQLDGEDYGFAAFFASIDTLLMGRLTWETVLRMEAWPYAGKRVVVLTHRPAEGSHGESFLAGEPAEVLAALRADGARRVYVDGGAVISQFLTEGLVDELTLSIVPIVLGDGIRLFQGVLPRRALRLASSHAYPSGLVQLRYAPYGAKHGFP